MWRFCVFKNPGTGNRFLICKAIEGQMYMDSVYDTFQNASMTMKITWRPGMRKIPFPH